MKKEIYILEDDDDIREMIQFLLEEEGYSFKLHRCVMHGFPRFQHKLAA